MSPFVGTALWIARGQILKFLGYAKYWKDMGQNVELPQVRDGQSLILEQANSEEKVTQPPNRYSEAKLVQIASVRIVRQVGKRRGSV